jgi:hypothetical protein
MRSEKLAAERPALDDFALVAGGYLRIPASFRFLFSCFETF